MHLLRVILTTTGFLLLETALHGHNMPQSAVMLDFGHDAVSADLVLPIQELELAFKQPLVQEPQAILTKYEPQLRAYLKEHIQPVTTDGKPWTVEVETLGLQLREPPYDLLAHVRMIPPPGGSVRKFRFNYSVTNHEVMSHIAIVTVRSDWDTAVFSGHPENLGMLQFTVTGLDIDRSSGSWTRGFAAVFHQGMRHISEGTDHLMFLLVLLLPAPLIASGKRWGKQDALKPTLIKLLKIVSAFTIGHSLTLAIAGFGWVRLPGRPVEILIAVSILVSAAHAIRPFFAGKEIYIAGGFGLVHGLAFAGTLSAFGFTPWYMALTILAFNLGIEAMQLAVVALVSPWIILLGGSTAYSWIRLAGASFAAIAAIGWIVERAFLTANPVVPLVAVLVHHAAWITAAPAVMMIAFWIREKSSRTSATPPP